MFKEVNVEELQFNPFSKISKEWMLITAGDELNFNTMTASWGAMGHIWARNSVTVYIRPQRYTKEFVDADPLFTLSFFGPEYKKALALCGAKSGRNGNKTEEAGLSPYFLEDTVSFEQASMIMVCKKMFHTALPEAGFDVKEHAGEFYPEKDFHTMYIGEVLKVFVEK